MKKKQNVNLIGRCYCCKNNIREMRLYQRGIVFVSSTPAPDVGIEPTTTRLKVLRSTYWANRVIVGLTGNWTQNTTFKAWSANHYTIRPLCNLFYIYTLYYVFISFVVIHYLANLKENILGFEHCLSVWYFCFNLRVNFDLKHGRLSFVFI